MSATRLQAAERTHEILWHEMSDLQGSWGFESAQLAEQEAWCRVLDARDTVIATA